MVFKPATPGFLVTLAATILLALVSFSVPIIKSIYFLRAQISVDGVDGVVTFGVLGFCSDSGSGANCTSPKVGYEFDPNTLFDNKTPIQIPEVIVKWLTDALVLHIVAFVLAAISAIFGLLAHIREFATVYCSTFISGLAASVALIAFIFDLAFFFLTKSRINKIQGASAQTGNAIWLTLAAFLLLFFAGCFYSIGRCCIVSRPRGPRGRDISNDVSGFDAQRAEALRLDAVKAESDRKARQKQKEMGLPAFPEYDSRKPLTLDDDDYYQDGQISPRGNNNLSSGYFNQPSNPMPNYVPAPQGTASRDAYYATGAAANAAATYPPPQQAPRQATPQRQPSYPQTYAGVNSQSATPNPFDSYNANAGAPTQTPTPSQFANGGQGQTPYSSTIHNQYPSSTHTQYPSAASDPYAATTGHSQSYSQYSANEVPGSYNYGQYDPNSYVVPGADNSRRQTPAVQVGTVYPGQPSNSPPPADYKLPPGIAVGQTTMGRDNYTFAPRS